MANHTYKAGDYVTHPLYKGIGTVCNQHAAPGFIIVSWPRGTALVPVSTLSRYEEE